MSDADIAIEVIADSEDVARLIFWPAMFSNSGSGSIDPACMFMFNKGEGYPNGQPESLVWRKYKVTENDVHHLGCDGEKRRQVRKPEARYFGFRNASVGDIRSFKTARGHGFFVIHAPAEGIHHAEIGYYPCNDDWSNLKKNDKAELRAMLLTIFSHEVTHKCD